MAAEVACHAAARQLSLAPNGDVFACCVSQERLGNIAQDRLADLWFGSARTEIAAALASAEFPTNCASCAVEVASEGRSAAFPAQFDYLTEFPADPAAGGPAAGVPAAGVPAAWPVRLDFMLSNLCNLQCVQCSGDLSSAIRSRREGRPPLARPYGDAFFEQLAEFIPHLRLASFEGGEPFLAPENYRVWELIERLNPAVRCTVCTNGTRLDDRVLGVIDRLHMDLIVSIDGFSPAVFEAGRVGARRDEVFANLERFRRELTERGRRLSINHCPMPQNLAEFADLLLWAESLQLPVNISVVRSPRELSLQYASEEVLAGCVVLLEAREAEMRSRLDLNLAVWEQELSRLRVWLDQARGAANSAVAAVTVRSGQRILGLPVLGGAAVWATGGSVEDPSVQWVTSGAAGVQPARLVVDAQERVIEANREAGERFGLGADGLVGLPISAVNAALDGYVEHYRDSDRAHFTIEVLGEPCRAANVALRDAAGVARMAVILVAPQGTAPPEPA